MKRQSGFSLIELLIVVAIILIIAAIAVPNLVRSRMAANESSAAQSIRTIATANLTYSSIYGIGYALDLTKLAPPAGGGPASSASDLLDSTLSLGTHLKSGYSFGTYTNDGHAGTQADPVEEFTAVATPISATNGTSTFCVDGSSVVRRNTSGAQLDGSSPGHACDPGDNSAFPPL